MVSVAVVQGCWKMLTSRHILASHKKHNVAGPCLEELAAGWPSAAFIQFDGGRDKGIAVKLNFF